MKTRPSEAFINLDTATPTEVEVYRARRAQKREPVVVIAKDRKQFVIRLDMTSTGARLNSLGELIYVRLAARLSNPNATVDTPIRVYSLATAEKAAQDLARLGRQLQNRQTVTTKEA